MFEDFRLRIFMEVASEGSFTKAAKKLGISQPAVSQNISELEKQVGVQLFERLKGEVVLTDAGKTFMSYASNILHWYHITGETFSAKKQGTRSLTICADPFIADYILPDVLSDIRSGSDARFTLRTQKKGDEDVILSMKPRIEALDFEGVNSLVGVVQPAYIASERTKETVERNKAGLDSVPIAVWSKYESRLSLELRSRVAICSDSVQSIVSMVKRSSSLVGIVPFHAVSREMELISQRPLPMLQMDFHIEAGSEEVRASSIYAQFVEGVSYKLR